MLKERRLAADLVASDFLKVEAATDHAALLAASPAEHAGRAFAAYGGVYICASLVWMAAVEKTLPDRWDLIGGAVCLAGAALILFGPRG